MQVARSMYSKIYNSGGPYEDLDLVSSLGHFTTGKPDSVTKFNASIAAMAPLTLMHVISLDFLGTLASNLTTHAGFS